jgi:pimeloyl-ACP methyl ester carboxylesterase
VPYVPVNGLDMYYEVHGDGSPLLLLHGGSGSIPRSGSRSSRLDFD